METVYRAIWKSRYKKLRISTFRIIRTTLYGDREKINNKLFLLNLRVDIRVDQIEVAVV